MRSRWLVLALVLGVGGVDAAGSATTIVPIGPTDFATIPAAVTANLGCRWVVHRIMRGKLGIAHQTDQCLE